MPVIGSLATIPNQTAGQVPAGFASWHIHDNRPAQHCMVLLLPGAACDLFTLEPDQPCCQAGVFGPLCRPTCLGFDPSATLVSGAACTLLPGSMHNQMIHQVLQVGKRMHPGAVDIP